MRMVWTFRKAAISFFLVGGGSEFLVVPPVRRTEKGQGNQGGVQTSVGPRGRHLPHGCSVVQAFGLFLPSWVLPYWE